MPGYSYPFGLYPKFPYQLFSVTLQLTASQFGNLFTTPQDLLPAQPGFACYPIYMYFHKDAGAYTIANQSCWISADSTPATRLYSPATVSNLRADQAREISLLGINSGIISVSEDILDIGNKKLFISFQTSNASVLGGAVQFTIYYIKVPTTKVAWDALP